MFWRQWLSPIIIVSLSITFTLSQKTKGHEDLVIGINLGTYSYSSDGVSRNAWPIDEGDENRNHEVLLGDLTHPSSAYQNDSISLKAADKKLTILIGLLCILLVVVIVILAVFVVILTILAVIFTLIFAGSDAIEKRKRRSKFSKAKLKRILSVKEWEGNGEGIRGNEYCAICHGEYTRLEKVMTLPCQHYFHEDCILPWLVKPGGKKDCPLCRAPLPFCQPRI